MRPYFEKIVIVGVFAVAMGFLEAVVVVYLRQIYYPGGFSFPLSPIEPKILNIELIRELTTLVILLCTGLLAGRSKNEKFAWFLFAFGIWDIIYYVGLKLFLGWPASLFTWDILFLIPVTWIGPVLAPVICALTMIFFSFVVFHYTARDQQVRIDKLSWLLIVVGALIIFISFTEDYTTLMIRSGYFGHEGKLSVSGLNSIFYSFVPEKFNWWLFAVGELFIIGGTIKIIAGKVRR